jgi:Protein of unknown function (DUF5672)
VSAWEDGVTRWRTQWWPEAQANRHLPVAKLQLPSVTLVCVECLDLYRSLHAFQRSLELCDFGATKFLTSFETDCPYAVKIPAIPSLVDYSIFTLKRLHEYVDTTHLLIVQHDGFVLNADRWDPTWLSYDYCAPLFDQDPFVGSGGFSLRTKALMAHVAAKLPPWDGTPASTEWLQPLLGCYEDGLISINLRYYLEGLGYKFMPTYEAPRFAQGGGLHYKTAERPFGYHRPDPRRKIHHDTGVIDPIPL